MARTDAMSRIASEVVAIDHLARVGSPAPDSRLAASVSSAYESIRRLGVIQGADSMAQAERVLANLAASLSPSATHEPREVAV